MKPLIIIGAGGHGKSVADVAKAQGYKDISFLDDNVDCSLVMGIKVVGKLCDVDKYILSSDFFVAIGSNGVRCEITKKLVKAGANIVTLIHPSAIIGSCVEVGAGVVIMPGVVINNSTVIEDGAIVNTSASIDHDCFVGAYSHVSVGARVAGTVKIGKQVFLDVNCAVINNISVVDGVTIGAGAVVVKDIVKKGVYVGVPCRLI